MTSLEWRLDRLITAAIAQFISPEQDLFDDVEEALKMVNFERDDRLGLLRHLKSAREINARYDIPPEQAADARKQIAMYMMHIASSTRSRMMQPTRFSRISRRRHPSLCHC